MWRIRVVPIELKGLCMMAKGLVRMVGQAVKERRY